MSDGIPEVAGSSMIKEKMGGGKSVTNNDRLDRLKMTLKQ